MTNGDVAVVVVTRDRRDSLLHTLDRLTALPEDPQVVVVDNGSSDGTQAAVRRRHPRVQLLRSPRNLGAAGRTLGARAADAAHLAFSDDDSWWAPGALHHAAALLDAHPRLGLIAARILVEPDRRLDPTCTAMGRSPLPPDPSLPGPAVLGFVGCGAVARRQAYLDCGGFEPRLGVGGEESLLAIDMAAAGWGLAYVDAVVAHHRPAALARRVERDRRLVRNDLWTVWLRRPPGSAALRSAEILAAGAGAAPRGLAAAVRGLPWVLRERRPIPDELDRALRALERATPGAAGRFARIGDG